MATITKRKPAIKKTKTKIKKPKIEKILSVYEEAIAAGENHHDAQMIEAIHVNGLSGNIQAGKFWLSNRSSERWSEQAHLKVTAQRGADVPGLGEETKAQVTASIMALIQCSDDHEPLEGESERVAPVKAATAPTPPDNRDRSRTQGRGTSIGATTTGPTSVANKPETTAEHYRQKPGTVTGRTTKG